jgi:hypothetical protein
MAENRVGVPARYNTFIYVLPKGSGEAIMVRPEELNREGEYDLMRVGSRAVERKLTYQEVGDRVTEIRKRDSTANLTVIRVLRFPPRGI